MNCLDKFDDMMKITKERTGTPVSAGYDPDTHTWSVQEDILLFDVMKGNTHYSRSKMGSVLFSFYWHSSKPCSHTVNPEVYNDFLATLNKAIDKYLKEHPRVIAL